MSPMDENDNPWLTVAGAARYLGFSASTIIRWSNSGELPHIRTKSGYRRFSRKDLDTWKEDHRFVPLSGEAEATEPRPERFNEGVGN